MAGRNRNRPMPALIAGRYRITRLLGEGGMGAVYEAVHTGTDKRVALKVIISDDLAHNTEMVARFEREARAAGQIDTQHIVQIFDAGYDAEARMPFIAMEFMKGEDLLDTIKRLGPLRPELALRITAQACLGLARAHEAGVVHRDIKSANLYLARRDGGEVVVKLLDFGIAKMRPNQLASAEGVGLTRTGAMMGSPLYMSPEQAKGARDVDGRTDIWSMGVVLYEALSGVTPLSHIDSLGSLILAICSDPPPPLRARAPWVPPEVEAIVHRALQIDPDERYPSAQAMVEAIRVLLPDGWALREDLLVPMQQADRGSAVAPTPLVSNPPPGASTTAALAATRPQPSANPRRGVLIGAVTALMSLGLVGGVIAWGLAHRPEAGSLATPEPSADSSSIASPVISVPPDANSAVEIASLPVPAASSEADKRVVKDGGAATTAKAPAVAAGPAQVGGTAKAIATAAPEKKDAPAKLKHDTSYE